MSRSTAMLIDGARDALQRRDGGRALALLGEVEATSLSAVPWLMVAQASRLVGDVEREKGALSNLLNLDARDLLALLLSGDLHARTGDDRGATSFYQTALNVAALRTDVPPQWRGLIEQAQAFLAGANDRFTAHLLDGMDKAGLGRAAGQGRVGAAIDLLLGRTPLYLQQPSAFYFPGLPQRHFYEREEFDWIADFERETPALLAELQAVLADGQDFAPYVQTSPDRPRPANPLADKADWGAWYHWRYGEPTQEALDRCQSTLSVMDHAPIPRIAKRSPMALWSLLKPSAHIQPHHGLLNTRLICHLPLIAPEDCSLRVGASTRPWRTGEMLIFDDSVEHEAWNHSAETRVVLLFEIWRPEITQAEREALTVLFETINDYQGLPDDAV